VLKALASFNASLYLNPLSISRRRYASKSSVLKRPETDFPECKLQARLSHPFFEGDPWKAVALGKYKDSVFASLLSVEYLRSLTLTPSAVDDL